MKSFKNCIITGEPTKGKFVYKKNRTQIPLSKEGNLILRTTVSEKLPFITKEFSTKLKGYYDMMIEKENLPKEFADKAYDVMMMGGTFHPDAVSSMIYRTINGSIGNGVIGNIIKDLTIKYVPTLKTYIDEVYGE